MLASYDDLKAHLEAKQVPFEADDLRQVVEIPTYIRNENHSAVLLWDPRAILLHVIQPLPFDIPPRQEPALIEAVVRVNHSLVLPGFGYDHLARHLYFRWVVAREPEGLSEEALDRAIRTVLETCRDFLPTLRAVVAGRLTPAEVVEATTRQRDEEAATRAQALTT